MYSITLPQKVCRTSRYAADFTPFYWDFMGFLVILVFLNEKLYFQGKTQIPYVHQTVNF